MRIEHIPTQEIPCLVRMTVGDVETDVTAPDDGRPGLPHRRRQPSRLGIVQDHDVPRMHQSCELLRGPDQRLLVDLALGVAQGAAVSGESVQAIVQPLGDGKEWRLP